MKLNRFNFVSLTIVSAVAVALCTLPSGGQELPFTAPKEPPVPGVPAWAPMAAAPLPASGDAGF